MSGTSTFVLQPMQWSELQDIDAVSPLSEADAPLLAELRDVLRRHGATERFGITLLHRHFELAEDECLLERTHAATRTLTLSPAQSGHGVRAIATCWKFAAAGAAAQPITLCECPWDPLEGRHANRHERR